MTSRTDVASIIDHTLLKPEATPDQFRALVNEAAELGTYSVCVSPSALPIEVPDSLHIATVVGFPSGAVKPEIKAAEAARAVADGAEEVDMVINIPLAIEGRAEDLQAEIQAVRDAIPGKVLKVIIESAALSDDAIVLACKAAAAAQADFVKTSTGFVGGGARVEDIRIMKEAVGDCAQIKASGGIHSYDEAMAMIAAGATRIGASAGLAILAGAED